MGLEISEHERAALAELAQFPLLAAMTGRTVAPVSGRRPDPRRGAGLHQSAAGPAVVGGRTGPADFGDGRRDGLEFRDHAPSRLRAVVSQLLGKRHGADLPVGGRFSHQPAVFHRRHPALTCCPAATSSRANSTASKQWISHTADSYVRIVRHTPRTAPRRAVYGRSQHLDRQSSGQSAGLPGGRPRRTPDGEPVVLRGQRLSDPSTTSTAAISLAWNGFHRSGHTPTTHFRCRSSSSTRSPRPAPNSRSPPTTGCWHCRQWVSAAGPTTDWTGCPCWAAPVIRALPAWASSPTTTTAGLSRTSPGYRDISRRSARRTCRRSRPEWRSWSSENSSPGGPFHPDTPGPWSDTAKVRGSALPAEGIQELVTAEASYIYDTFGKLPGTVPTVHVLMYLQAQHLDTDFYDELFGPGAYLRTHADHQARWH